MKTECFATHSSMSGNPISFGLMLDAKKNGNKLKKWKESNVGTWEKFVVLRIANGADVECR